MKTSAIIPVKPFAAAKSRLSSVLSAEQRFQLAEAMLRDVLSAACAAESIEEIFIVTSDPQAAFIAGRFGARVIDDTIGELNGALAAARSWIKKNRGSLPILVLPADLPAATAGDIDALSTWLRGPSSAVIVPAHDGDGTNAILSGCEAALSFSFGPGSFQRHVHHATMAGLHVETPKIKRLGHDLDRPEDIKAILQLAGDTQTARWLEAMTALRLPEMTEAL